MFPQEKLLTHYGGVEHTADDLQKRWKNSVVVGAVEIDGRLELPPTPLFISDNDGLKLTLEELLGENNYRYFTHHFYVIREFPSNGVFISKDVAFLLTRTQQRQWRRGTNTDTVTIETLETEKPNTNDFELLSAEAFVFKPVSFDVAVLKFGTGVSCALTRHLWLKTNDRVMASLYYDDVFIGMVDAQRNFISHSESVTLAEEAIHELGLRPL